MKPTIQNRWLIALAWMLVGALPVLALTDADLVRLQKAGVGKGAMAALVASRAVETGAVTVDGLLALKAAGVADETLCALIRAGSFLKHRQPVVTGSGVRPIRLSTVDDILRLKAAGLDDRTLRAVIDAGAEGADALQRRNALRFLEEMGLRIDLRKTEP